MKKVHITVFLLVIALIAAGCSKGTDIAATPPEQPKSPSEHPVLPEQPQTQDSGPTIEITSEGFNPQTLIIKAGDTVTFINKDTTHTTGHWPASAFHPTHTEYLGSDIAKCGTSEENSIFDACKGLKEGGSYKFKFDQKGSWKYHDHLNPSLWGTIVVA